MKILILLSLLSATAVFGQSTNTPPADTNSLPSSTNNFSVVLTFGQEAVLRAAHKWDGVLRTNGLPPYTNSVAEITFKKFVEGVASEGLKRQAEIIQGQRLEEMLKMWQLATPNKQEQALQKLR